jgi:hypothetical protein
MGRIWALVAAFSLLGAPALADTVGMVKTATGAAAVVRGGADIAAEPGMAVERGDVLKTGADGAMGVTLNDGTLLSAGPNTRLSVDAFAYAPPDGEHSMVTTITRGTIGYLSGQIAQFSADAVQVNTPAGTVAVRGTHMVIAVETVR